MRRKKNTRAHTFVATATAINHQRISTKTKHSPPATQKLLQFFLALFHSFPFIHSCCSRFRVSECVCVLRETTPKNERTKEQQQKKWLMIYVTLAFWQSQLFALREKTSFSFRCLHFVVGVFRSLARAPSVHSAIHRHRLLTRTACVNDCYFYFRTTSVLSDDANMKQWVHTDDRTHTHSTVECNVNVHMKCHQHRLEKKSSEENGESEKSARHHNAIRRFAVFRFRLFFEEKIKFTSALFFLLLFSTSRLTNETGATCIQPLNAQNSNSGNVATTIIIIITQRLINIIARASNIHALKLDAGTIYPMSCFHTGLSNEQWIYKDDGGKALTFKFFCRTTSIMINK